MTDHAPVALITGAAHRLGAATAEMLHGRGYRILVHYRSREHQAQHLADRLNEVRAGSATILQADLSDNGEIARLCRKALAYWDRLDVLVNNASVFYPTPVGECGDDAWCDIMQTNVRAPVALVEHLHEELRLQKGCIVNMIDIYAERPLENHPLYNASKAALASLTRSWAKDLAPDVRVNGVSPGAVLWPENHAEVDDAYKKTLLKKVPLHRPGEATDIASAITWLVCDAPYVNGQIINVDGGRSVNI